MEAEFVVAVSAFGVLLSVWMVADSIKDMRIVVEKDRLELLPFAVNRLINEVARFLVQFMFMIAAAIYAVDRFEFIRDVALLLLIGVPTVVAIWSVYSAVWRRAWLKGD